MRTGVGIHELDELSVRLGMQRRSGGRGYLRSAQEIGNVLPQIAFLLVEDYAEVAFPGTGPAAPAEVVIILPKKTVPTSWGLNSVLPVYFNWEQWNRIAVPLLRELQTSGWRGRFSDLGTIVQLLQAIYGPNGEIVFPEGLDWGLLPYTNERPGVLYPNPPDYMREMQLKIVGAAEAAGY